MIQLRTLSFTILLALAVTGFGQGTISDQLDSLEQEIESMDSIKLKLDEQAADLEQELKDAEEKIRQAEAELVEDKKGYDLSPWMVGTVLLILVVGIAMFMRKKRSQS